MRRYTISIAETKYYPQVFNWPAGAGQVGRFSFLNTIAQGVASQNRIGNKIFVKSISGRIRMCGANPMNAASMIFRIVMVKAKCINQGTADITQIFDIDNVVGPASYATSCRNAAYLSKFKIVYDKTLQIVPVSVTTGSVACGPYHAFDFYIPVNETVVYTDAQGTDDTISDTLEKEDYYLFFLPLDTACCIAACRSNVAFKDM